MNRGGEMPISVYLLTIALPLITVLVVFAMKYVSQVLQARARLANDGAYQALAEKALASQADLAAIRAELSQATATLAAIEKILKQVG